MLNNNSNQSIFPFKPDDKDVSSRFSIYLSIIIGLIALIGTIFSLIDLRRFILENDLRTHFNYLYHYMLVFCLFNSLIYVPCYYLGIYLSWFIISPMFCRIFQIHGNAIFAGLVYLLMWTSLERHRFLFRINTTLSFTRQIFPLIVILIFVYTCSILIVLLPQCSKQEICEDCLIQNSIYVILFTFYTFIIPIIIMICSTGILLWRLVEHRTKLNKPRRWIRLKRMFYQSIIYLIWYSLAYWPYTIYSLLISYDSNRFNSVILKNTSYLMNIYGIQMLPILTYFLFKSNKKRRENNYALSNRTNINQQQKYNIQWFKQNKQMPIVERF